MKEVKKKQKVPNSYKKTFPFLILLATIFMSIGYASSNSITVDITGDVLANAQYGIFITDVVYESNQNADIINSKIKNYNKNILNSRVVLSEDDIDSFITYKVTIYNSTNDMYAFEDIKYVIDEQTYDNDNITFDLIGLENMSLLPSKESITFSIKFYYRDSSKIGNNTLNSYLNFSFKRAYSVKYVDIEDNNLPKHVLSKNDLVIDLSANNYSGVKVSIDDVEITNYTYKNKILTVPNINGDVTIQAINSTCLVTFDTNMDVSKYASTEGFIVEEKNEASGDYYRASFNKTTGTTDEWYRILFPEYDYEVGATYRIRMKTRLQEISNLYKMQLRHSAIKNDWGTEGREYVELKDDKIGEWKEYELTRTFTSSTIMQDGTQYELAPRVELYTGNLKLENGISKISLTIDYKDVYVGKINTLEYNYGNSLGSLPTPTRKGYIFEGWYTEPKGGTKIDSSTVVTNSDVVYYAHWVSASEKSIVTFDTNMDVSKYVSTEGFTIEEKTDQDGKFYTASFKKKNGKTDDWYHIEFENYNYQIGGTYKIRMKTRVQNIVGGVSGEIRHAAMKNDWGTDGVKIIRFTDGKIGAWTEYTLTRTFTSPTIEFEGETYSLSPHIEIYTNNLTLAGGIKEKSLTFDFKDVYVSQIINKTVDYGGSLGNLPTPTRDGYVFKGWYTKPEGGTQISSYTIADFATATYYAQWIPDEVTLYKVSYINVVDNNNYPTFVEENGTLVVDMANDSYRSVAVKINGVETNNYTYTNGILTVPNVTGNVEITVQKGKIKIFNKEFNIITDIPTLSLPSKYTDDKNGLYVSTKTNDGSPTYYFRGNIEENYVDFAGFEWRVLRVNEDGTIRLIMHDGINDNAGYQFKSYPHDINNMYYSYDTNAKSVLEDWYNVNIVEQNLSDRVVKGTFCEQARTLGSEEFTSGNAEMVLREVYEPTFECKTDGNGYGLFSANISTITYDELLFAGASYNKNNYDYYLYNANTYWLLSPAGVSGNYSRVWYSSNGVVLRNGNINARLSIRPVINVRADVTVTGSGTADDHWIIQ